MMTPRVMPQELKRIIDHVFLPPKLPQCKDEPRDSSLIAVMLEAMSRFRDVMSEESQAIGKAIMAINSLRDINSLPDGYTCQNTLEKTLSTLADGDVVAVKVEAQNAAIMITRQEDKVVFEEFELSAGNSDVIGTTGRLTRSFPGLAVAVDWDVICAVDTDFCKAVSHTIAAMSRESVPSMQPRSKKKGHEHEEERDTTHPGLISELLVGGILRGFGSATKVQGAMKQTRDEVLWDDAYMPWRRSAMWLLIRVVLQLTIVRSPDGSRVLYKELMVFLMSTLLERSMNLSLESDMFHVMNAKITQRLHKLEAGQSVHYENVVGYSHAVLRTSCEIIQRRWTTVQVADKCETALQPLPALEKAVDTTVHIPALEQYLELVQGGEASTSRFQFSPSSQVLRLEPDSLPVLPDARPHDYHYAVAHLRQLEIWICEHLSAWARDRHGPSALRQLHTLFVRYHGFAEALYAENPEGTSIMLLTIFELWLACDRIANASCAFMEDYDPDIPVDILENLLLPFKLQMDRLHKVERYFHDRKQHSSISAAGLFDIHSRHGFPARYFESSSLHHSLLSTISAQAEREKSAKMVEFDNMEAEHARLTSLAAQREHEYVQIVTDAYGDYQEIETRHANNCQRCKLEQRAAGLSISVHEWPLPADRTEAKGVVFELQVPEWFVHWRDARQYLIVDVLKGEVPKNEPHPSYRLSMNDPHLSKSHYRQECGRRIGLLSEVKPNVVTHYSAKKIHSTRRHEVCLRNGLFYKYYDSGDGAFIDPVSFSDRMILTCTYRLPATCRTLRRYLIRPATQPDGVAPNAVIASQDDCPDGMTIEEYKDLATIPLGRHIQWSHILLQLAMPEVDFKKPETYLIVLQCLYQAGPPSEHLMRQSHIDCGDVYFTSRLLDELRASLERVRENWDSLQALNLFVHIITRVLSLSDASRERCFELLDIARSIAMGWARRLQDRAYESQDASNRAALPAWTAAIALVCGCTFDVDEPHLQTILRSTEAASALISCSILEQQGRSHTTGDDPVTKLLTLQFRRVLHRAYQALYRNQDGLNDAIGRIWSAFTPDTKGWHTVRMTSEWVVTHSVPKGASVPVAVHFNAVSGELLIDGCPLDRPPQAYREQALFADLFGREAVEVMPTQAVPGFSFCTLRPFGGLTVYLGVSGEDSTHSARMRVRATDGRRTFEVIPHELFENTYPTYFVENHVHWYDFESGDIEFRPKKSAWIAQSTINLTLRLRENGEGRGLDGDGFAVLGLGHPHFQAISSALAPLALKTDIHMKLTPCRIHIDIPKVRLGFFVECETCRLMSRELPSMEVAADQTVGTLVGLRNRLILQRRADGQRKLLLPEGPVSYHAQGEHVLVRMRRECISAVHTFDVDEDLGKLIDKGSMRAKLLLAYLHALTSSCLPDPFTGRTGTEQALMILRSAAVRSCHLLTQEETDILASISRLTPGRAYYPRDKRVMQTISWDSSLSFLSQHTGFLAAVRDIYDQTRRAAVLQIGPLPRFPELTFADDHLTARDRIRSSSLRISGFGAEDQTPRTDRHYQARDRSQGSKRAKSAALMSGLFRRELITTHLSVEAREYVWSLLADTAHVNGTTSPIRALDLSYRTDYLEDWKTFVSENWLAIHSWMRRGRNSRACRFALVTCLSTMAFSDTRNMPILQALAMCADIPTMVSPEFRDVQAFFPDRGTDCTEPSLRAILNRHLLPFDSSPENGLGRKKNESKLNFDRRRRSIFQSRRDAAVGAIIDRLLVQWRRRLPSTPVVSSLRVSAYVNVNDAMIEVRQAFERWYDNGVLFQYLEYLERAISARPREALQFPDISVTRTPMLPSSRGYVAVQDMFSGEPPDLSTIAPRPEPLLRYSRKVSRAPEESKDFRLRSLIDFLDMDGCTSRYERKYIQGLGDSLRALERLVAKMEDVQPNTPSRDSLMEYLEECRAYANAIFGIISVVLTANIKSAGAATTGQHPRISPYFIVQQLCRHRWTGLTDRWRACVVAYGISLTGVQHAQPAEKS